jgi:60S ribosomal export protein NMD3
MKDSKQVYRMTYLVRIPAYRKDDFFSFDGSYFLIVSLHENKVRALELTSWTEKVIEGEDISPSRIYGGSELIKEMMLVSQSKNEVQVMDSKTYATVDVQKPKPLMIKSSTVKTVKLDGYLFLLPS